MADIRIKDLPTNASPSPSQYVATDLATTQKLTVQALVDIGVPVASQAEAEAGVQATKRMTPLTTKQAIAVQAATFAQGALADSAVQPGDLSAVATTGNYNDLTDQPSLSANLIYPVKADAVAATIPSIENALQVNGSVTEGDGLGGLYIDTNNGSADTFVSSGGTSRTWYRAGDVSSTRLVGAPDIRNFLDTASYVSTRTAAKALDTTKETTLILTEAGREGIFNWKAGDYSAQIAADTAEGVYLKANAIAASAGAWVRIFNGTLNANWFGVVGDASSNNYTNIVAALALGLPLHFPSAPADYNFGTTIVISGAEREITCDADVVLAYTGAANAFTLTGSNHTLQFAGVGSTGTAVFHYYNLGSSNITVHATGGASQAIFRHLAASQTSNAGNNRWTVSRLEAGSCQYGLDIQNSATFTLEGEMWDVKVLYSATVASVRIGTTAANQKVRWNDYQISPDAQGITPTLLNCYQDNNFFNIRTWQGIGSSHVTFQAGTGGNILYGQTGVQGSLLVTDNGANFSMVPGQAGQMLINGRLWLGLTAGGGSRLQVGENASAGTDIAVIENTSSAANTTKFAGFKWRGRDTINSGKDTATARAHPADADWTNATYQVQVRRSDVLALGFYLFGTGSPQGVVTAPVGAIYTRQDGGASTTLYVKESGTGNTGWVAK